jgi:hypothetical protein
MKSPESVHRDCTHRILPLFLTPIHIATAIFCGRSGAIDQVPILADNASWKKPTPCIYTLVKDDLIVLRRALQ